MSCGHETLLRGALVFQDEQIQMSVILRVMRACARFTATCVGTRIATFALVGVSPLLAQDTGYATSPTIAISAGPAAAFPDSSGDFENTTITGFAYAPTWSPWTFHSTSGIARNGSGILTALNPGVPQVAPQGLYVAFVEGAGSFDVPFTFTSGTWRLRFLAAQRSRSTGTDQQRVTVTVGATEVFSDELRSASYEGYTTRAFAVSGSAVVSFHGLAASQVALFDSIRLEQVAEWGSASTWTNGVPTGTVPAVIPATVAVALRGSATAYSVTVNGDLVAAYDNADLTTHWVAVSGPGARFEVGRPNVPYLQQFELRLVGDDPAEQSMGAGTKFLMAMDSGVIDMHGKPKGISTGDGHKRSWTKLVGQSSATQITVADPVNWEANDWMVIAGSRSNSFAWGAYIPAQAPYLDQSEVVQIAAVSGNNITLKSSTPLMGPHSSASLSYANSQSTWTLDRRAEVGLLSHNIAIRGIMGTGHPEFGGHVMIMRAPCCGNGLGGAGRFSGVEFDHLGQKMALGRYPIHWHMQQNQGFGQYLACCSIHDSFNRAVVIHGSEGIAVEGNVISKHVGHGVFLEDGSERFNSFYYNLAMGTTRPPSTPVNEALIPSDNSHYDIRNHSPATFWITNPNNTFVGNTVAGSEGTGFWFIFPSAPLGLSGPLNNPNPQFYSQYFNGLLPDHEPLGQFVGNTCHSAMSGFDINDSIRVDHTIIENGPWSPASQQNFDGFTAYGCEIGIYAGGSSPPEGIRFRAPILADNLVGVMSAANIVVEGALIVRQSMSLQDYSQPYGSGNVFGIYDGAMRLYDTHIVGFDQNHPLQRVFTNFGGALRSAGARFRGITSPTAPNSGLAFYMDDHPVGAPATGDPRMWGLTMIDVDGSLCGMPSLAGRTLVSNHPLMRSLSVDVALPNTPAPPWPAGGGAFMSPHRFAQMRLYHPGLEALTGGIYTQQPDVSFERSLAAEPANVAFLHNYKVDKHKAFPVVVNPSGILVSWYVARWPSGLPSTKDLRVQLASLADLPVGTTMYLALEGVGAMSSVTVFNETSQQSVSISGDLNMFLSSPGIGACIVSGLPFLFLRLETQVVGRDAETVRIQWQ